MMQQITRSVLSPLGKNSLMPLPRLFNCFEQSVLLITPKCDISSNILKRINIHKNGLHSQTFLSILKESNRFQSSVMQRCISRKEFPSWTSLQTLMKSDSVQGSHCLTQKRCISKKHYQFPELKDADLEEEFVRGSGPGGQSVNQTANCVVLKHLPTGIVVKCHESRSQERNRQRARERLQERLDLHLKGDDSYLSLCREEASAQRQKKKKENKRRLELKKSFKEREGLE